MDDRSFLFSLVSNLLSNFMRQTFERSLNKNKFMEILREFDPGSG